MKKLILIGVLFALLQASISVDDLLKNLADNRQAILSYSAEVITVINGNYLPAQQTQTGSIYFQAPDYLRTDAQSPIVSTVTKGKKSWTIDRQGNVQEIIPEQRALQNFQDLDTVFKEFSFTCSDLNNSEVKLIGIPKDKKSVFGHFSKIVLIVDTEKKIAKEIRVHNLQGSEIAKILTTYTNINNINFPTETKTIITYGKNTLSITTSYKNILLNQTLPAETFDLEHIKQEMQQSDSHA